MHRSIVLIVLAVACCPATQAQADICAKAAARGDTPSDRLESLISADCLGGISDNSPVVNSIYPAALVQRFRRMPEDGEASAGQRAAATRLVLDAAQAETAALKLPPWSRAKELRDDFLAVLILVRKDIDQRPVDRPRMPFLGSAWKIEPNQPTLRLSAIAKAVDLSPHASRGKFIEDHALTGLLAEACTPGDPQRCAAVEQYFAGLIRISNVVSQAFHDIHEQTALRAMLAESRVRDASWTAYFEEARSQTPLELWLNGQLWNRAGKQRHGFRDPPDSQIILLHPGVALEYVSAAPDGDQFKPALQMELLGYNRWHYGEDGTMGTAWGGSLIAVWSDREGVADLGYGVALHYKHALSAGVTWRDGEPGWMISVDALQYLTEIGDKVRDRLQLGLPIGD